MVDFSKTTTLLSILLIVFVIIAGVFAYQWWHVKGELIKQIKESESLTKQITELQKELEELRTTKPEGETVEDKKEEVTITTNKIEYKQGEKMKVSLDYDGDLYVWDYPLSSWFVQRKVNNSWIDMQISSNPCMRECKDVPPDRILGCALCPLEPPAWYLEKGNDITFIWDQRYIVNLETYQCYNLNEKVVSEQCKNYKQVPPGEYKIKLEYALNIKNRVVREGVDIKYVEKDFKIVE